MSRLREGSQGLFQEITSLYWITAGAFRVHIEVLARTSQKACVLIQRIGNGIRPETLIFQSLYGPMGFGRESTDVLMWRGLG
ncbi:hypothetical protein Pmi06nite_39860 [Planotetraspora mira]|uniref:Uncharacterized protein n=1 Tax=Planotetraspora mira TaxID=58121 RepID=A0A8J3X834_9ACTN|nr:hypothetical protein Pmi06nite_39860 [Planotetraspora mira]